jgi:hypothetical protein
MSSLIDRMLANRDSWCELAPATDGKAAKRVKLRRPAQCEILRMQGGVNQDHVLSAAVGWEGFTEADLLGPEIGSSDPVAFDADVWKAYAADNVEHLSKAAEHLMNSISEHIAKVAQARKN